MIGSDQPCCAGHMSIAASRRFRSSRSSLGSTGRTPTSTETIGGVGRGHAARLPALAIPPMWAAPGIAPCSKRLASGLTVALTIRQPRQPLPLSISRSPRPSWVRCGLFQSGPLTPPRRRALDHGSSQWGRHQGRPVLLQPAGDKSRTLRVIGGAGGKLNTLKPRGVKSEGECRQLHAEKSAAKRSLKAEQRRRDKELGIHDSKQAEREKLKEQRRKAQVDFIKTVADAMGWDLEACIWTRPGCRTPL